MTLPNLLIAGFPKAGTGSLFGYLTQHPDVCGSVRKEVNFFTPSTPTGMSGSLDEYASFFRCGGSGIVVEATPKYSYGGPLVRSAIRGSLPDVRVVLILRDPAERLWSAYRFQRSLGHLHHETFEAYVLDCERMVASGVDIHAQGYLKGLTIGMYGTHVPPWIDDFGSAVRTVFFDDLARDPRSLVATLCTWLGLDPAPARSFSYDHANKTMQPRSMALARAADRVRAASRDVVPSRVGRVARRMYASVNARPGSRSMPEDVALRVRQLYAASNRALLDALRRAGVDRIPPWLEEASSGSPHEGVA